jgi:deoxyribodipyrimidine photo-lyase
MRRSVSDMQRRVRSLRQGVRGTGPVVYWMSRDQRADDNWALFYAQHLALERQQPLAVLFNLVPDFLGATWRQYHFMLEGLKQVESSLNAANIPLVVLTGVPERTIPAFISQYSSSALITDFSPLRPHRQWYAQVGKAIACEFWQVDTHNIVPCWEASTKREYAAYTFRPKVQRQLDAWLTEFPPLVRHPHRWQGHQGAVDWKRVAGSIKADRSVTPVTGVFSGGDAARARLKQFLEHHLADYEQHRNDPNREAQTGLSPYLHFGQIAPQRVAWEIQRCHEHDKARLALLEQLIIRRELSDNFCYYCPEYDAVAAFPDWAATTLAEHQSDPREHLYSLEQLEQGSTHDPLWNAAQEKLVASGTMHGYLRMYWAKKILQWSPTASVALEHAICLNDRYQLDGRDPNGYAGIAWSIGGVHDRPWFERDVFGKVRYMSYDGCRRKFDVERYIADTPLKRKDI